MILAELKRLAETEGLLANPHYEPKPVPYLIVVNSEGRCVGIQCTNAPDAKGKLRAKPFQIPRRSGRTSGDQADFLVDKAEYVFGIGERDAAKLKHRQQLFADEVAKAVEATKDAGLISIQKFLTARVAGTEKTPLPAELTGGDLCAFIYEPDVDVLVSSRPAIEAYWTQRRTLGVVGEATQCLICGMPTIPVDKHPSLKNVPGANTAGAALVSFNFPAAESLGLERNENAPVCRSCADAYTTALNRLLHPAYPSPRDGTPLPRWNYRLSADTVAAFWTRRGGEFADIFAELLDGSPEAVHALLGSPWHGRAVALDNSEAFYVLILSGAQGRVILRDWFASTVRDVAANLKRYFDDLVLVRQYANEPEVLPLWQMLKSLVPPGKSESLPPALAAGLFEAALYGHRYPLALLDAAMRRMRAGAGADRPRVALIKAVLKRNFEQKELKETMDTTNPNVGYRLGRLFAVLEKLKDEATGGSMEGFIGAASATPVTVFPRLLKTGAYHSAKLGQKAIRFEKLKQEILDPMNPDRTFPSTLPLPEQGLFFVGYYQQRADFYKPKTITEKETAQ